MPDITTTISEELTKTGERFDVYRHDNETDTEYGDRILTEIDEIVNQLWDCQDQIRELLDKDCA